MKGDAPAGGGGPADDLQLDSLLEKRLGIGEAAVVGEGPRVCMKRDGAVGGSGAAGVLQLDSLLEERLGVREAALVGEGPRVYVKRDGAAGGGVATDILQLDGLLEERLGVRKTDGVREGRRVSSSVMARLVAVSPPTFLRSMACLKSGLASAKRPLWRERARIREA